MIGCWLSQFSTRERVCSGRMDRAHLVPQQLLRREGHAALCPDPRLWKPACRLHHGMFDGYTGVVVPRDALPVELEELCLAIGLDWYLDRRYGVTASEPETASTAEGARIRQPKRLSIELLTLACQAPVRFVICETNQRRQS
jgi:hypothetical protein